MYCPGWTFAPCAIAQTLDALGIYDGNVGLVISDAASK